ncbi:helix-turn-helix transcriptional regulator [Streptomyces yaizuensis]|uniref:HTH cro/C1-type domain-containing protein n=1 Tax=Streptomyces yaizuensis TaxID=2989713 RepID=A0AA86M793_9ACTN|nr:transcriptional regulator [Streptomyces sp. YSPA8]BDT39476.1 hypothetical protein SYYSPA8_36790 [Streptomyces sp. YSPA8]
MAVLTVTRGWDVREAPDDTPAQYVARGTWPDAVLSETAPPSAHIAQAVARRLRDVLHAEAMSGREAARAVGISHVTIGRILKGDGLPDARTVFLLEVALRHSVWPVDFHQDYRLRVLDENGPQPGAYPAGAQPDLPDRPVTTPATRVILRGMAAGQTHAEIGAEIGINPRTVGKRLANVYDALDIPPGDTFRLGLWWASSAERLKD